jgi:hypothetical protein
VVDDQLQSAMALGDWTDSLQQIGPEQRDRQPSAPGIVNPEAFEVTLQGLSFLATRKPTSSNRLSSGCFQR